MRKIRHFVAQALTGLAGVLTFAAAAPIGPLKAAADPGLAELQALQDALRSDRPALAGLLSKGQGLDSALVTLRRRELLRQFPDATWTLSPGPKLRDGRNTVELRLQGSRQQNGTIFRLDASQQLVLNSVGGRITGQTVLREQSLLRSGEHDLPVSLLIPDAVLTGQRYDVDVYFDEPLNGALIAGGLLAITSSQVNGMQSPKLELDALGGGGLFKTVQAPYTPGEQTWAVLLVHPEGIVSATKRVRVVSDRSELTP